MRNKINVMNRQPEITDEELERFKNFDSLLNKHYRILNEKKPVTWKVIVPAIVLIASVVLYWFLSEQNIKPVENHSPVADSVIVSDKKEDEKILAQPEPEKNNTQAHAKTNSEKSTPKQSEPRQDSVTRIEPELNVTPIEENPKPDNAAKPEVVYIQAEPLAGYEALYAYFSKELIYPEAAVKDSIEGVLIVKFLISKEGKPEKIQTSGALGVLFDKEAVRLIEHMPLWKPATVNGKPISSKLSLPLTFQLRNKK